MFGNSLGSPSVFLMLASLFAWVVPVLAGGALVYYAVRRGVRDGLRDAATPSPPSEPSEPPSVPPTPPASEA